MRQGRLKDKDTLAAYLNVSTATIVNWIKTGTIPAPLNNEAYTAHELKNIANHISTSKLKGRANRSMIDNKAICYHGVTGEKRKKLLKDAIEIAQESGFDLDENILALSVALLQSAGLLRKNWHENPETTIECFLSNWLAPYRSRSKPLLSLYKEVTPSGGNEDFVGAFYQSLQSLSSKSKTGSFYTPSSLLEDIRVPVGKTILDPCCGSGNILLRTLSKKHSPEQIHAWDIDALALKICRVNFCLFFENPKTQPVIREKNLILENEPRLFNQFPTDLYDFILTNPPWGSKFSREEKQQLLKGLPQLETTESFSLFLYHSLNLLKPSGNLVFFLPHAFLNVSAHSKIRKHLLNQNLSMEIRLLGNAFKGVLSEAIRLDLRKTNKPVEKITIYSLEGRPSSTLSYSDLQAPDYIIPATASKEEQALLDKLFKRPCVFLKNNAHFALGIVTGDNNRHLTRKASAETEPIFRGKDIVPFGFAEPEIHIRFDPSSYQQIAPVELYRQKKIVYRFISDRLVCALDRNHRLLLNSANLFIPTIDYPFESLVALFNSTVYTFIYRKIFHSKKVLRSHIESFPIPILNYSQHSRLKNLHDEYAESPNHMGDLDKTIYEIFDLNLDEIQIIKEGTRNGEAKRRTRKAYQPN